MALDKAILEALAPRATPYKVTDSKGLYLLIQPNGGRYWRFRYRWAGKQNTLSCGVYPEVPLDEARSRRDAFRAMLSQDVNPNYMPLDDRIDAVRVLHGARDIDAVFNSEQ